MAAQVEIIEKFGGKIIRKSSGFSGIGGFKRQAGGNKGPPEKAFFRIPEK